MPSGRTTRPATKRRSLPRSAEPFIARTVDQVDAGLRAVAAAASVSELAIGPGGHPVMRDNPISTVERSDAELVRTRLYARVGRAQLPELLLAVDGETHFTWELLGRAADAPEELIPLYAAIVVAAMALGGTDVAMRIPGVRLSAIRRASVLLENERALRRANDAVVSFLLAQPLSKQWGDGYEASSAS